MASKDDAQLAPAPAARPAAPPVQRVEELVNEWFVAHIQNTAIAQEARAYAQALVARDALKAMLLEKLF